VNQGHWEFPFGIPGISGKLLCWLSGWNFLQFFKFRRKFREFIGVFNIFCCCSIFLVLNLTHCTAPGPTVSVSDWRQLLCLPSIDRNVTKQNDVDNKPLLDEWAIYLALSHRISQTQNSQMHESGEFRALTEVALSLS